MRYLLLLVALCGTLRGQDPLSQEAPDDKWLVWVNFALEDDSTSKMPLGLPGLNSSETTVWISEKNRGEDTNFLHGMTGDCRGGSSPDPDTHQKWLKCAILLRAIREPKQLPSILTHIVTVGCVDGDKMVRKKFPIDHVPPEVHQILLIMGFTDANFKRLKFAN